MNLDGIWTWFLDLVGQLLVPGWNDLIGYIPLLLVGLVILAVAGLAWWWQRHSAVNRPRVPPRLPSGRKPADLHMPGPSLWPFVAPIGLLLMVFALAIGVTDSLGTLALFGLGAAKVTVTRLNPIRSGLEMLIVGGLAAGVAYVVGALLKGIGG